ncbi:MAG TPA: hypothetical protein VH419_07865 [Nocardioidaceae bacterium]
MSGMKVRHDFAAGEETISAGSTHHGSLTEARDQSSTLHKTNQAALGDDVAGSEQVASIAKQQFERDTTSIDSASKMLSSNQRSQDIQQSAAQQATKYFGNR